MKKLRLLNSKLESSKILKDISLLLIRLVIAYGFWEPALMKWQGLSGTADWFGSMGYPLPMVSALLAAITEMSGVILVTIGLGVRWIAMPMIFMMLVAIFTIHISNGFAAGDNGFEIPLYYGLMLLSLVAFGSGRISFDNLLKKK